MFDLEIITMYTEKTIFYFIVSSSFIKKMYWTANKIWHKQIKKVSKYI